MAKQTTITSEQINAIKSDREILISLMSKEDNEKLRKQYQYTIHGLEAALRHLGVEF